MFVSGFPSLYSECGSVGRNQGTLSYLVPSKSVSDGKSNALLAACTTETHTPAPLATVFLHMHRRNLKSLPNQNLGSVGIPETNIHFWFGLIEVKISAVLLTDPWHSRQHLCQLRSATSPPSPSPSNSHCRNCFHSNS